MTGVSRSGDIDIDDSDFEAVAGDATDSDDVARLIRNHDAIASALRPSDNVNVIVEMAEAVIEALRRTDVNRLVWTGGAGGLNVDPEVRLIETDGFPAEVAPLAQAHIEALDVIREANDIEWSYIAPPVMIEPGKRTGEYRTAEGKLVTAENDKSHISMEDFAVAFVDELEDNNAIHTQLGFGY